MSALALETTPLSTLPWRLVPVPPHEPPFDDELDDPALSTDPTLAGRRGRSLQAQLPLRVGAGSEPDRVGASVVVPLHDDPLHDDVERRTPTAALPDPQRAAAVITQAVLEVLSGARPAHQLTRSLSEPVLGTLRAQAAHRAARRSPGMRPQARPLVRSVRTSHPDDGVVEASAVVQRGPRCVAVALRLEGWRGAWRCTALEIG